MSARQLTPRERWLSAVCDLRTDRVPVRFGDSAAGAPRQPGAFRTIMALLSMYADNDTGANARPSLRLLQSISHYKYDTVRGALSVAQRAGFITATGTWTPPKGGDPITVWALGYPTPDGFEPWCMGQPVTPLGGTTDGDSAGRNHRPESGDSAGRDHRDYLGMGVGDSAGRNVGDSAGRNHGDSAGRSTTSSTSSDRRDDEDDESASAPPPDGGAIPRLPDGFEPLVFDVLSKRWDGETPVVSNRSRSHLAELLASGWTPQAVLAGVSTIGKKPRNAGLLLESHLKRLRDEHTPGDFGVVSTAGTNQVAPDPLSEENQDGVTTFCKWTGANPTALSLVLADLTAAGYTVRTNLRVDDYASVTVQHPDCGDLWRVYWEAFRGKDLGEYVEHNEIRATLQGVPLIESDRAQLANLGVVEKGGLSVDVTAGHQSVAVLRRFVEVTGSLARAAVRRMDHTHTDLEDW